MSQEIDVETLRQWLSNGAIVYLCADPVASLQSSEHFRFVDRVGSASLLSTY